MDRRTWHTNTNTHTLTCTSVFKNPNPNLNSTLTWTLNPCYPSNNPVKLLCSTPQTSPYNDWSAHTHTHPTCPLAHACLGRNFLSPSPNVTWALTETSRRSNPHSHDSSSSYSILRPAHNLVIPINMHPNLSPSPSLPPPPPLSELVIHSWLTLILFLMYSIPKTRNVSAMQSSCSLRPCLSRPM